MTTVMEAIKGFSPDINDVEMQLPKDFLRPHMEAIIADFMSHFPSEVEDHTAEDELTWFNTEQYFEGRLIEVYAVPAASLLRCLPELQGCPATVNGELQPFAPSITIDARGTDLATTITGTLLNKQTLVPAVINPGLQA